MIKPNSNHILQAQFDNVETCEKLVKFYSSQHQKCKSVQSNRTVHMHWSNCACTGWSARCSCSLRRFYSCSGSCDNHAMVQSHMRGMIITRHPENLSVGASRAEQTVHTLVPMSSLIWLFTVCNVSSASFERIFVFFRTIAVLSLDAPIFRFFYGTPAQWDTD